MVKVSTFAELSKYVDFFTKGKATAMMIQSVGGVGKTETVKRALKKLGVQHTYKTGHMTVTELVRLFYEHRDELIVIDDVDALFQSERTFSILRAACDTGMDRKVEYASPSYTVADIPQSFSVTSQVLLLVNSFPESPSINAFKTRAVCVEFQPTPEELSKKLHEIVVGSTSVPNDPEVIEAFDMFAPVSKEPNFRAYILSALMKPAGIDWKKHLSESMKVDPLIGAMLRATQERKTFKDRQERFVELTGKSGRTYARLLHEHKEMTK